MTTFRQATLNDVFQIFIVETNCFVEGIRDTNSQYFEDQIIHFPRGIMVAEDDHKIIGYIMGELVEKDHNLREQHIFSKTGECLYITSFAVLPDQQKAGIGKKLFFEFIKTFPQKSIIGVVNPKWTEVYNFYKRIGFIDIKELPDFFHPYGQNEPGIVLELK
jgi:ribosomal protein S18 acetylase RimI-like enzyme